MAQQFTTVDGVNLVIPGAYPSIKVETNNSGLSTTGVLMLVGEADAGPDWSLEDRLQDNSFGPDELAAVIAKYKSGNLVNAFQAAAAPANDPDITGSPNRIIVIKTNVSSKASSGLLKYDTTPYGTLYDKSYGKLGNLIYYTVAAKTAEVIPTTGAFTYLVNIASFNMATRSNGAAEQDLTVGALTLPPAFQAAVDGLAGVVATGGAERGGVNGILGAAPVGNISVGSVVGNNVVVTFTGSWTTNPSVGDTFYIPSTSGIAGAGSANVGSYVVTGSTNTTVSATKLLDASGAPGTLTPPVAVAPLAATAGDVHAYAPITITQDAANPIDGYGKSLEIIELTTGTDRLSNMLYALNTTKVTFVSKSGSPKLVTSSAEYVVDLNVNRQVDNVQEDIVAGGEIGLSLQYTGTTATVTITATTLSTTVVGGAGANLSLTLADFPTLSDLASFINAQTGYSCSPGTTVLGQQGSGNLDRGTYGICSTWGASAGRIKIDAFRFFSKLTQNGILTQLGNPAARAAAGLPAPLATVTYLAGGAKGSTTDAGFNAAVDAAEKVRGNFLIPLFSRDAAGDVLDALTESGSSYTIANIHAYSRTHVLKMSTLKRRRNRQAFLSVRGTFLSDRLVAANIASFRCSMCFQDVKTTATTGGVVQYQPWMAAVVAAGMQAAGFYKAIVAKGLNVSGALQAAKDYDDQDDTNEEDALLSGLLPIKQSESGGFIWVSDQTTYGKDNNFVFNSIQATYGADTVALTTATRMEKAFVGQSIADVSAALALTALEAIMDDMRRLKLIAPSDDAPKGFKNALIKISGPAMIVSLEIKLAGAIYFVPISFLVSQVTQAAAQ